MTSREIAEYTGKRHDHVLADIRTMLEQLEMTSPEFSGHLPDAYGRPQHVFILPKDLTLTLVSGYSVPMRHAIIKRWQALEKQRA
jgi:phage regulator Rha-like protein